MYCVYHGEGGEGGGGGRGAGQTVGGGTKGMSCYQ